MKPPWLTERLLDSFIENPQVAEDLLGDLAEEWHERSQSQGPRAASWWYRKQAASSLFLLLRSGCGPALGPALFGAALAAALPLFIFTAWAGSMTAIADFVIGMLGNGGGGDGGETLPLTRTAPAVWAARALLASLICGVSGGFLLGWLGRVAAMVQVTLLAALWVPCALALQVFAAEAWPEWYGLALPVLLVLGTFAGGIGGVAIRRSGRRPRAHGAGL